MKTILLVLAISLTSPAAAAPAGQPAGASALPAEQEAFWSRLKSLCGKAFRGRVADATDYYAKTFGGKAVVIHVMDCSPDRIHIPLHIGEDRSRNWILTRADGTIRLKHDHRHKDGSEDKVTQYGGDAPIPGLPHRQIFPADAHTGSMLPERADNFWFMDFVKDSFQYGVHWPRAGHSVRLEFDLTAPAEPPVRPWGYERGK
ncbi:MAG TPA: hypothetical protein VNT25_04850 [Allosphingosinicella sp.]|nr:hypothetical protein [Allosphingosinicella sp.]